LRLLALSLVLFCLWIPGAGSGPPKTETPAVVPLRMQVKILRGRLNKLQAQVDRNRKQIETLRNILCLQVPSC